MKHQRHIFAAAVFLLFTALTGRLPAQVEFDSEQEERGPDFHVDLVNTAAGPESPLSRLNIYMEVIFDDLAFIKEAESFKASYEVSVTILDADKEQVDGKVWKESPAAETFDVTNRRSRISQSHRVFDLDPGSYKVEISVQDLETRRTTTRTRQIRLRDFAGPKLQSSDILLISELSLDTTGVVAIRPQVSDAGKGVTDSTMAFLEIYSRQPDQEVNINWELHGSSSKTRLRRSFTRTLTGWRNPVSFFIHADSLPHDFYTLSVEISGGGEKIKENKELYIRWRSLPSSATDLKSAIDQLRYIATKEEWRLLSKAKGDARLDEFRKFWLRHDPSPGTEANETMDLYYSRVEYANSRFSVMQRPGWRTDMGTLYIILGPPDDVERNAYPRYSKPYEIWSYYQYSREFVFLDYTGFGDYRLETPVSIYEFQRLLTN